ncbi:hypothetical protein U1Q18_033009 [Sarracenia purpurea var. burkii]
MANLVLLSLLFRVVFLPFLVAAVSFCNRPCRYPSDCGGTLNCSNGKCKDDPAFGTHICGGGGSAICKPDYSITCPNGKRYPIYGCSPPVTHSTPAKLTRRDFSEVGGGFESECDDKYHAATEWVVSLSTGWYNGGSRCGKTIRILASNGRKVEAKVVEECDSLAGCDEEHVGQPPCGNNVVEGSDAVWKGLGLNKDLQWENVTWSMA